MKAYYILILSVFACFLNAFAQKNPVAFLNRDYKVIIDTTSGNKFYAVNRLDFIYRIKNIGEHVFFIDSFPSKSMTDRCITKPGTVTDLYLDYHIFFGLLDWMKIMNKASSATLKLPFYYEGKVYTEEITCNILYGKGNLISVDTLNYDLTEKVEAFLIQQKIDTVNKSYPNLELTVYFTVKNTSGKTIQCTKDMMCFWDNSPESYKYSFIDIMPGESYQIPLKLQQAQRYFFNKMSFFVVRSEGVCEVYPFSVKSNYRRNQP